MSKKLIKSGLIVSLMTLISRVLGLVRDVVVANIMGANASADVFLFANKIPNFLRRLFAEGAFAQAFVPVLSEYQAIDEKNGTDKTRKLIAEVSGTLGTIITLVTIIGVICSPVIVALFGFGWFLEWLNDGVDGEKYTLASTMLKITFPYLWFITLTALSGAILNTLGKFAVASFTPVLLNVCIISTAVFTADSFSDPAYALAWGVFIGGLVQLLFQLPFLYRAGVMVKPKWAWRSPGVVKIRTLIIPALFGVSVTQINLLLDTLIASFLGTGPISWLYYADRLLEFPLGLFGIGIATVILPSLSRLHANQNTDEFDGTLSWALMVVSFLGIPAMAGLMVLAQPIIMVLFMHGAFTETDVTRVGYALFAYLSGLMSFMFIKVLAPGYYARQDTKTPVKIGIIAMVANMAFNLTLAPIFGYVGLAAATAMSATLNAFLLYRGLKAKNVFRLNKQVKHLILKAVVAGVTMAAVVVYLMPQHQTWLAMTFFTRVTYLLSYIGLGLVTYLAMSFLLGVRLSDFKVATAKSIKE